MDPRARVEVKALLKELRRMGKTILISSHILTELADCCTSIGIIERGQLLMHGPIDEVYNKIRGNQIMEANFGEGLDQGLSIIRSNPDVRDIQVDGSKIQIEFNSSDYNPSVLLKQLIEAGVEVRNFGRKEPNLEDVFMMVTKGLVS